MVSPFQINFPFHSRLKYLATAAPIWTLVCQTSVKLSPSRFPRDQGLDVAAFFSSFTFIFCAYAALWISVVGFLSRWVPRKQTKKCIHLLSPGFRVHASLCDVIRHTRINVTGSNPGLGCSRTIAWANLKYAVMVVVQVKDGSYRVCLSTSSCTTFVW